MMTMVKVAVKANANFDMNYFTFSIYLCIVISPSNKKREAKTGTI